MMRVVSAALAAFAATAAPAPAQVTYAPETYAPETYAPGAYTVVGAPTLVVPQTTYVPRTRYVRRTVLVPRTHVVRRTLDVPVTTDVPRRRIAAYPVAPYGAADPGYAVIYPGTGLVGPIWVPPGTTYSCLLGTVGCDSSVVGPMGF